MENNAKEKTEIYLKEHQKKFEEYSREASKEANEVFRELVRQLILVATVFLSISAFVFNFQNVTKIFNIYNKHLLICSWILAGFSIIFGVVQFFVDYYFFAKWSKINSDIVEDISEGKLENEKSLVDEVTERTQKEPDKSCTVFVWLQVFSLGISIILLVIFMIGALFSL